MNPKYYIKKELLEGKYYYMIYKRFLLFPDIFYERWNTKESAETRLNELLNK